MGFWENMARTAGGAGTAELAMIISTKIVSSIEVKARNEGRENGLAERASEVAKLKNALNEIESRFGSDRNYFDFILALQTVGMACAVCDGVISSTELLEIDEFVAGASASKLPLHIKDRIAEIAKSKPSLATAFKMSRPFLQDVESKQAFEDLIELTMYADGEIHPREEAFLQSWKQMAA